MAGSIRDRVAVVGMGCSKFGERWDAGMDDLIVEAAYEAFQDAGIESKDIQAAWVGTSTGSTGNGGGAAGGSKDEGPIIDAEVVDEKK